MKLLTTYKDRKTGKVSILVGEDAPRTDHESAAHRCIKLIGDIIVNDDVSELVTWEPRRTYYFSSTAEAKAVQKVQADWDAEQDRIKKAKLAASAAGRRYIEPTKPSKSQMKPTHSTPKTAGAVVAGLIMLFFLLAMPAQAQRYELVPLISGATLTNNTALSNAAMVAQNVIFDVSKQTRLQIAVTYGCENSEKHTNYLYLAPGVSRTVFDTENQIILELGNADDPAAGAARCFTTNLTAAFPFYLLQYTTNHSAATFGFTNYYVYQVLQTGL